ncbi:MAG: hypothetical protein CL920_25060 [Deltaproteobacteria bacterium]|nr:hypothetical protein [Deltaproteobacteria bacterium]MBU51975.1 hypothetical protein [Deltaproteobacteria bacterium]|tara:strand:+ start:275 stop:1615 length:1341 start_codon:yes stop_codon:yes gene_type:complete
MRDIERWLDSSHQRPDGSTATVPTRWAVLASGVESTLGQHAKELTTSDDTVYVVCDDNTLSLSERVERCIADQGRRVVRHHVANKADGSAPSADDKQTDLLAGLIDKEDAKLVVSVGAGTINDIAKYASFCRSLPYLSYATASSMNGYTSGIAALYVKGLKSTVPCAPPIGVYADPEVIAQAPALMNLAGLGDLCSKPFAGADASVANLIKGMKAWQLPIQMVEEVFDRTLEDAEKIGQNDAQAVADLMETLWISGFSMLLAGSSAPASGGEHLWSHRLDMERHDAGLPPQALHGTQVGIACGLVHPLFVNVAACDDEHVQQALSQTPVEPDPADEDAFRAWFASRHPELGETSMNAAIKESSKKYNRAHRLKTRAGLREHWSQVREQLQKAAQHAERVNQALQLAKAPVVPQDIDVSQEDSDRILGICRDIRDRLTILDLAADIL